MKNDRRIQFLFSFRLKFIVSIGRQLLNSILIIETAKNNRTYVYEISGSKGMMNFGIKFLYEKSTRLEQES